jgi:hypothetical protein
MEARIGGDLPSDAVYLIRAVRCGGPKRASHSRTAADTSRRIPNAGTIALESE